MAAALVLEMYPGPTPTPDEIFRRLRLRAKCTDSGDSGAVSAISNLERSIELFTPAPGDSPFHDASGYSGSDRKIVE